MDHLKRFNDVHGHAVGDLVLRLVARLLSANVKGRDTAARYGGEEFAVLLEGAELAGALAVADQIRAGLDGKRLMAKGVGCDVGGVTVSVSIAQFRSGETAAALLSRGRRAVPGQASRPQPGLRRGRAGGCTVFSVTGGPSAELLLAS